MVIDNVWDLLALLVVFTVVCFLWKYSYGKLDEVSSGSILDQMLVAGFATVPSVVLVWAFVHLMGLGV